MISLAETSTLGKATAGSCGPPPGPPGGQVAACAPDPEHRERLFSALLRARPRGWRPFDVEFGSHYARGMLSIRNGGYTALLSYDKASRLAQMQVSLNVQAVPPRYMPALFYVQGRTRVARIILEPDGRGAVVQVSSLYLDPSHAGIVVGLMVLDLQALLRDDRLVSILGIGRDNGSHKVREGGAS